MLKKGRYISTRKFFLFWLAACMALVYLYTAKETVSDSAYERQEILYRIADRHASAPLHVQDRGAGIPLFFSSCLVVNHAELPALKPGVKAFRQKAKTILTGAFRLLLGKANVLPGTRSYLNDSICSESRLQIIFYMHSADGSK